MGGFAWVTLATNDSYSLGALVLAHSLKQAGTKQQLVVLITPGISEPMRQKLAAVFNVIQEVNILDSKDEANLKLLKRPELGITFTKLHCWRLTQFEKCVFLDADTLVVQNCDELFDREEFSAAPDVGWPDCFNSGVFVYRPSNETYDKLVQFALDKGSFDGGDQGLLNLYFSDWSQKDISKHLPFIYNMCSTACYSYLPAFKQYGANAKIVHFIGSSKPWLQYFDTLSRQVHPSGGLNHLQGLLQKWWDIFCNLIHPELSSSMKGLAGAFAQLTLGSPRSAEQIALEDQLRRQSWEVGNIDYLGRDSFDNIWSKICETLATCPAVQAEPEVAAVPTAAPEVAAVPTAAPEVAAVPTTATKTEAKEQKAEETPKEEKAVQVLQQEPPKPDQVSETALNSEKPKDDPVLISPIPCTETSATAPTETQVAIPAAEVAKPVTEISAVKPEVVSTSTPKDDLPQVPPVAPLPAGTETVPVSEAPTKEEQKLLETAPVISEVPVVAPAQPPATTPPVVQSTPVPLDAQAVPPKDIQSSVEPPKQEQIPSTKASEQTKPADVQTIAATTEVPKDEKKADVVAPIENITSPVDLPKKETTAVPVEAPKEEKTPILAEAPKDDKTPAESVKDVKAPAEAQTVAEAIKESVTPVVTETPKDSKTPTTEDTKATTPEVQKEAAATPTENKSLALTEVKTKLPEEPVGEVVKPGEGIEKLTETAKPPQEEKPATPITVDQTAPTESQQKSVAIPLGAPPSTEVPQTAEPVPEKIEPCKEVSKECTECPVVKETAQVTEVPKNVDTQVIKPENVPCKEESATKALEGKDSAKSGEEVPVSVAKASKECKESPECQTTCSKPTKCTKPDKESKQCSKSQPPKEDKKQIKEGAKVAEPQKESGDCKKPADQKPAPSQEKEQKTSEAGPAKPVETPTPPPRKQGNGSGKKTGKPKK